MPQYCAMHFLRRARYETPDPVDRPAVARVPRLVPNELTREHDQEPHLEPADPAQRWDGHPRTGRSVVGHSSPPVTGDPPQRPPPPSHVLPVVPPLGTPS